MPVDVVQSLSPPPHHTPEEKWTRSQSQASAAVGSEVMAACVTWHRWNLTLARVWTLHPITGMHGKSRKLTHWGANTSPCGGLGVCPAAEASAEGLLEVSLWPLRQAAQRPE